MSTLSIPVRSLQFDDVTMETGVGVGAGTSGVWGNELPWAASVPHLLNASSWGPGLISLPEPRASPGLGREWEPTASPLGGGPGRTAHLKSQRGRLCGRVESLLAGPGLPTAVARMAAPESRSRFVIIISSRPRK